MIEASNVSLNKPQTINDFERKKQEKKKTISPLVFLEQVMIRRSKDDELKLT